MTYVDRLMRALEFIEANLAAPLSPQAVAERAHFSVYHFQRIFRAMTGCSLGSYIRKRRLTEASHRLRKTDSDILAIALGLQYESQEAFSRAFKKMYGLTPGDYRNRRRSCSMRHQYPLSLQDVQLRQRNAAMPDKIVNLGELIIVGLPYHGPGLSPEIGATWERFMPRLGEIRNVRQPVRVYGLCQYRPDADDDDGTIDYIAGAEVEAVEPPPPDMVLRKVAPQSYAVFTHRGPVAELKRSFNYIFGTWFPQSSYEPAQADDLGVYDERFIAADSPESEFDLYIPVAPRRKD